MARYLSLFMQFEGESLSTKRLERIFASSFFEPVALGAIDAHTNGDNWFLAGYALEDFLARFLERGVPKPAHIELAATQDDTLRNYLNTMADHLSRLSQPSEKISPFEKEDQIAGVTFLRSAHLDVSVLSEFDQWLARFPKGILYLYGSVKVAVQKPHELPWRRAFRCLYPPEPKLQVIGAPFLTIRMGASPFLTQAIEVSVRSESLIWLSKAHALNGRVGKHEADENLDNLASFTKLLAHTERAAKRSVELHAEGSAFNREVERLKRAFTDVLGAKGSE